MTDVLDLTAGHRELLGELLRRYIPEMEIWAYGSRVKGTARRYSDLVALPSGGWGAAVPALREALDESDLPFSGRSHVSDELPESFHERIREGHVAIQKPLSQLEKA